MDAVHKRDERFHGGASCRTRSWIDRELCICQYQGSVLLAMIKVVYLYGSLLTISSFMRSDVQPTLSLLLGQDLALNVSPISQHAKRHVLNILTLLEE
jgi:hypothetical protein